MSIKLSYLCVRVNVLTSNNIEFFIMTDNFVPSCVRSELKARLGSFSITHQLAPRKLLYNFIQIETSTIVKKKKNVAALFDKMIAGIKIHGSLSRILKASGFRRLCECGRCF